jgi:hypothetical protein
MMLYDDKVKENQQLKDKLESVQHIQTAMLAYVLATQGAGKTELASGPTA